MQVPSGERLSDIPTDGIACSHRDPRVPPADMYRMNGRAVTEPTVCEGLRTRRKWLERYTKPEDKLVGELYQPPGVWTPLRLSS
jgi:hypothetical protein